MQTQPTACDAMIVSRFLAGALRAKETADFEAHLAVCEQCRQQLDEQTAAPDEWNEMQESLRGVDSDLSAARASSTDEIAAYLALLGPTDDPRMAGRIGTYEVTGLLGHGGMGVVFKALDPALNRYVAIKMLSPMFLASGSSKQRFLREAQSAAAVVHEHVVGIHATAEWRGIPYLVMTYVRGESLQTRLATRGTLSLREVLRIGMQIASGLAAAHNQGLIHRDIKPANILLESDVDRVKITDFGLARTIDDLRLTGTNTLLGTPEYMSPEQARDEPLDFRTDLFSLGCVLYEASVGRSPFRAATSYGSICKVNEQTPPSVTSLVPELPDWFARIVECLLQKQRDARYSSADEVATLLKQCLAHVEQPNLSPLPKSLLPSIRQRILKPSSRRILMTTSLMMTALVSSWMLLTQFVGLDPTTNQAARGNAADDETKAEGDNASATPQPVAEAGKYVIKVRKADAIDQFRLAIKPTSPAALFQGVFNENGKQNGGNTFQKTQQSSGRTGSSTSTSGGTTSTFTSNSAAAGGKVIRPNLGVVFEIETREKVILELDKMAALDDQGNAVEWSANSPFNFYDPEFEKNSRGALVVYFMEENGTNQLKSVTGELKVTPGRLLEVEFPAGKTGTKKSGEHSFTLKELNNNDQGVHVTVVLPQLTKTRGNQFGNAEAMLKAMLAQRGAFEIILEDSEGVIHYSSATSGGSAGGSSSSFSSGGGAGSSSGGPTTQGGAESTYTFAALPNGREVKAVIIRATERKGNSQSYPFKMDMIPIPYSSSDR